MYPSPNPPALAGQALPCFARKGAKYLNNSKFPPPCEAGRGIKRVDTCGNGQGMKGDDTFGISAIVFIFVSYL